MVGARALFHMEIAVADVIAFSLVPLAQEVDYLSASGEYVELTSDSRSGDSIPSSDSQNRRLVLFLRTIGKRLSKQA